MTDLQVKIVTNDDAGSEASHVNPDLCFVHPHQVQSNVQSPVSPPVPVAVG